MDPATFLASNSVLRTLFSSENSLVYSVMGKICISEFVMLPHQYCNYYNSEFEFLPQNNKVPIKGKHTNDLTFV